MAQHGYQAQPETHRERANHLKRERHASLDPVEKEAMAQLRRESRRKKDPERNNHQYHNKIAIRKRLKKKRIALNENVEQVLILWRKKLRHNSGQLITGCCRLITGCWRLITGCWRLIARGRWHGHDDGVLGRSRQWKVLYIIPISLQHLNYRFVTISTSESLWTMQWRIHKGAMEGMSPYKLKKNHYWKNS